VPQPTDSQVINVCGSHPIATAAKYAGSYHPLVIVVDETSYGWSVDDGYSTTYSVDDRWVTNSWTSPLQLVVCVGAETAVRVSSCGYYNAEDGAYGQVVRYKYSKAVRVKVAKTGKTLQSKTFYGSTPSCSSSFTVPWGAPPPWKIYGGDPNDSSINTYATKVSTQKAK
jgi:hypothetical protein